LQQIHTTAHLHDDVFSIIKTENLYLFDGVPGFTAAQGQ
jgi:hypothetical protein